MKKINFTVIDKDVLLTALLVENLNETKYFEEIVAFEKIEHFWEYMEVEQNKPHVVLLEIVQQEQSYIPLINQLRNAYPSVKVIAYSSNYQLQYSGHILNAGARAYCSKSSSPQYLLDVILEVVRNDHYWTPQQIDFISNLLSPSMPKQIYPTIDRLTTREREILRLLAQQMTTREIAKALYISVKTIDSHKTRILEKTGARNAVGLAVFAIQNEIIGLDEIVI